MSALQTLAKPRRIKASHRRRRKSASGPIVQRYYDPQIGRFLSVDPVTADGNTGAMFNRYYYSFNNPFSFFDPNGREPKTGNDRRLCQNAGNPCTISGESGSIEGSAPEHVREGARKTQEAVHKFISTNRNDDVPISTEQLATLLELRTWQLSIGSASDMSILEFYNAAQIADSQFFNWAKKKNSERFFVVEDGLGKFSGRHSASDINYFAIGMLWAEAGYSSESMVRAIDTWNRIDSLQKMTMRDIRHIPNATGWAQLGRAYYEKRHKK